MMSVDLKSLNFALSSQEELRTILSEEYRTIHEFVVLVLHYQCHICLMTFGDLESIVNHLNDKHLDYFTPGENVEFSKIKNVRWQNPDTILVSDGSPSDSKQLGKEDVVETKQSEQIQNAEQTRVNRTEVPSLLINHNINIEDIKAELIATETDQSDTVNSNEKSIYVRVQEKFGIGCLKKTHKVGTKLGKYKPLLESCTTKKLERTPIIYDEASDPDIKEKSGEACAVAVSYVSDVDRSDKIISDKQDNFVCTARSDTHCLTQNHHSNKKTTRTKGKLGTRKSLKTRHETSVMNLSVTNTKHGKVESFVLDLDKNDIERNTEKLCSKEATNTGIFVIKEKSQILKHGKKALKRKRGDIKEKPQRKRRSTVVSKYIYREQKVRMCFICRCVFSSVSDCLEHYEKDHNYSVMYHKIPVSAVHNSCESMTETVATPLTNDLDIATACDKSDETPSNMTSPLKETTARSGRNKQDQVTAQCPYCRKTIPTNDLNEHIHLVHVWFKEQRKMTRCRLTLCELCGKKFKHIQNYDSHIRNVHQGIKRRKPPQTVRPEMKCDKCSFKSCDRRRVMDHIKAVHEGQLPHQCEHCSYQTWERTSLRDHMYRHSEDKKFKCNMCSYRCIQKKQLRAHLNRHHGVDLPKNRSQVNSDGNSRKEEHFYTKTGSYADMIANVKQNPKSGKLDDKGHSSVLKQSKTTTKHKKNKISKLGIDTQIHSGNQASQLLSVTPTKRRKSLPSNAVQITGSKAISGAERLRGAQSVVSQSHKTDLTRVTEKRQRYAQSVVSQSHKTDLSQVSNIPVNNSTKASRSFITLPIPLDNSSKTEYQIIWATTTDVLSKPPQTYSSVVTNGNQPQRYNDSPNNSVTAYSPPLSTPHSIIAPHESMATIIKNGTVTEMPTPSSSALMQDPTNTLINDPSVILNPLTPLASSDLASLLALPASTNDISEQYFSSLFSGMSSTDNSEANSSNLETKMTLPPSASYPGLSGTLSMDHDILMTKDILMTNDVALSVNDFGAEESDFQNIAAINHSITTNNGFTERDKQ